MCVCAVCVRSVCLCAVCVCVNMPTHYYNEQIFGLLFKVHGWVAFGVWIGCVEEGVCRDCVDGCGMDGFKGAETCLCNDQTWKLP